MSDIIAHIVFDNNNVLKSIEIVGDHTDYKTDLKTIVESGGEKDFYIKISVKQCANASMDCFSLSNGNMYQLDFDDFDFSNHVPIDKLLTADSKSGSLSADSKLPAVSKSGSSGSSSADSKSGSSSADDKSGILSADSKLPADSNVGADLNLHRFKELIVGELNKISKNMPSENVPSEEEKDILPMFKQLIVDELNKILKNAPSEK